MYFQTAGELGISGIKYTITDIFDRSFVPHLIPVLEYCHKNGKYNLSLQAQILTESLEEIF